MDSDDIKKIAATSSYNATRERPPAPEMIQKTKAGNFASDRMAFCKTDAGYGSTIQCYLDTNLTGKEVTVHCSISNASNLNEAVRDLEAGDWILVRFIGDQWRCTEGFQGWEECDCYEAP